MLLGTSLNLGNTTSDLRIEKGCTKIIKIFGSCQLWDAPKRKDPIISSMRCSHDPFLSLKTFPRKPSNSSKISSNPSKVTIGFFIALGAAVRNIHKEAFIWTLMHSIILCLWHLGRRGALKRRGNFCCPATLATQSGKNSKTKATSSMPSAKKWSVKVIFSSVVDFCFIWVCYRSISSQHSNLMVHFQVRSQVKIWSLFSIRNNQSKIETKFPIPTRPTDSDEFTGARIIPLK